MCLGKVWHVWKIWDFPEIEDKSNNQYLLTIWIENYGAIEYSFEEDTFVELDGI